MHDDDKLNQPSRQIKPRLRETFPKAKAQAKVRVCLTRIIIANMVLVLIVQIVKVRSMIKCLALLFVTAGIGTGCSGIATSQSFSPLMFFLPGLGETRPVPSQIVPLEKTGITAQMASNRDSAQVN
jgi:hypothetical protein